MQIKQQKSLQEDILWVALVKKKKIVENERRTEGTVFQAHIMSKFYSKIVFITIAL